ncbi:MAG: HD domain-containing protein [Candidatus Wallbacteria bacterium]
MFRELNVPVFDMVMCLSKAMDLVNPIVVNHQLRVAYIAFKIGEELKLPKETLDNIVTAGAIHDAGAMSLKEKMEILNFEAEAVNQHALLGYHLLKTFPFFTKIAPIVKFHHACWSDGLGRELNGEKVPMGSHILHLADRVDTLIDKTWPALEHVSGVCEKIKSESGKLFVPEYVEAFVRLAKKEYFSADVVSPELKNILKKSANLNVIPLNLDGLLELGRLFARIIDFRSRFTATHTSGVAACAEALSEIAGFSKNESKRMKVAGYLHDLGKLAIPSEILEKPGKLEPWEFDIIRFHTYHTYRTLEMIDGLEDINCYASFHHERLDGNGYPFHYSKDELPFGSRIMAVADVFTAITEDRPYRAGMTADKALATLESMASVNALDQKIVALVRENYEQMSRIRIAAQTAATLEYQAFWDEIDKNR